MGIEVLDRVVQANFREDFGRQGKGVIREEKASRAVQINHGTVRDAFSSLTLRRDANLQ